MVDSGMTRKKAAIGMGTVVAMLGIPSALNTDFLGAADKFVGEFLLISGGFFDTILVGWKLLPIADEELAKGLDNVAVRRGWGMLIKFVIPPVLLFVLIFTIVRPTYDAIMVLFQ